MKRARDIRDQFVGLLDRVEIELRENPGDHINIRKVIVASLYCPCLFRHSNAPDVSLVSFFCISLVFMVSMSKLCMLIIKDVWISVFPVVIEVSIEL